ncbi:hypothetical protein K438DRAFT_1467231, partial [Mycena galopus ATCC 62051]
YSSMAALLYYDFVLTLPKEIQYIWSQRFRLSTALYIGCRYALLANVLYLLAIADKLGCDLWYKIIAAMSTLGRVSVITVFVLRTSVLYGKNRWIFAYMSVLGLACIALGITHVPGLHCTGSSTLPMFMLSVLTVIFESSSAFLTILRFVRAIRAGGGVKKLRHGVMFMLFKQGGGVSFVRIISIFTVAGVIMQYYLMQPGFFQRLPDAFTLPLSCILTARCILHLREW